MPSCLYPTASKRLWLLLLSFILTHAGSANADDGLTPELKPVSYWNDVLPIFKANCLGCHQPAKLQGDYCMTDFQSLVVGGESKEPAIVSGHPESSYLMTEITPVQGHAEMPKKGPPLANAEIDLIKRWISEGAIDDSPLQPPMYSDDHPPTYTRGPVITAIDFSPDGSRLAVTGFNEALLLDTTDWSLNSRLIGLSQRLESVRFSPDGSMLAVSAGQPGVAGELQIWNVPDHKLLLSRILSFDTLFGISWSPDASLLAFATSDNVVRAIDTTTGEPRLRQGTHEDWPRATTFSVDGSHLISGGRDMTVKLTEVATERFIDNVTSITPGVLQGGVNSIVRHPYRDEILVGGSDGAAKLYRVFRQTARKIGDDANLLHTLPQMKGRIFSVAISSDAQFIAVASTLENSSQLRLFRYENQENVPKDIAALQLVAASERTEEQRKLLEAYTPTTPVELASWDVPETAIYCLAISKLGKLAAGGADGRLRVWDCTKLSLETDVDVTPSQPSVGSSNAEQLTAEHGSFLQQQNETEKPITTGNKIETSSFKSLVISPASIHLNAWNECTQLVVTAIDVAGNPHDVTAAATYKAQKPIVWCSTSGWIEPRSTGTSELLVRVGQLESKIALQVDSADVGPVDFVRDVNPVMSRLGCNSGTCHGSQAGKNGFKLSLRGYDPLFDVRALTDDLAGRRVNLNSPQQSLMLAKPLGMIPHVGGKLITSGDLYATVLHKWIADGAKLTLPSTKVVSLNVLPNNPVVQLPGVVQQLRVVATYSDDSQRDVTREAFIESGNTEVAAVGAAATVTGLRRGEAPLLARYEGAYAATTLTIMGEREGYVESEPESWNTIDKLVAKKWARIKTHPSDLCSDEEFLRRVYLDLIGLPPTVEQYHDFVQSDNAASTSSDSPIGDISARRNAVIDELISSKQYVEHWTNKWSDLLQVNSKFLGKPGAILLRDWIAKQIADNRPYNEFAHEILTASGSNRENPAAAYFKILRTPEELLENTTHLFLAVRFNCNKCHDHPFERWTQDQYYQTAAYFTQIELNKDEASGAETIGGTAVEGAKPLYEVVSDKTSGEMKHLRTSETVKPTFPFQCKVKTSESASRRQQFADWATDASNPYFARSYVNRLWGYLLGTGLIEPIDDIRAGNPASNPELLAYLEREFIDSGFDVQHIIRIICQSRVYQLSVASNRWNADDDRNYSHAKARRLPAEVLYDAIHQVTGSISKLPGLAEGTRAASLADADSGLPDGFLNNLGRPARESACECERSSDLRLGSIMALVSGPTIGQAIAKPDNALHRLTNDQQDDRLLVREIYLRVLNREPSLEEIDIALGIFPKIHDDNERLQANLVKQESQWAIQREHRESERMAALAKANIELADRTEAMKPERELLEQSRKERIAIAESNLEARHEVLRVALPTYLEGKHSDTQWHLVVPEKMKSTNQATLAVQADRSIKVSGNSEKTTYIIDSLTLLPTLTAFRLEALKASELPGGGPGLASNGNFVVTEIELYAGPASQPDLMKQIKLKSGLSDFDQEGYSAAAAIDGRDKDQGGWAISDAGGSEHWAVFALEQSLALPPDWSLQFRIHQFHNATEHRLAHFRISITDASGDVPIGLSESLEAIARTPVEQREASSQNDAYEYYRRIDAETKQLKAALNLAKQAIPPDDILTAIQTRVKRLEIRTPDDPSIVRMRSDAAESKAQSENIRVTAAEDLTWALINSPAFLFNH